jgi:alkyl hydroperoxide reductase subunit F
MSEGGAVLEPAIADQLRTHLQKITMPVEFVMSLDDGAKSQETAALLNEVAGMSDLITVQQRGDDVRRPSFAITRLGTDVGVRFAGVPMGHEFTSFVLAVLQVGGHPAKIDADTAAAIQALAGEHHFETYFSLSCQNCPDVVQALNLMSVLNPGITHVAIDGGVFPEEIEQRQVMAVPTVYHNGVPFGSGRMSLEEILAKLDTGSAAAEVARLNAEAPFDVLVVGGGPAGATAALYAARKGIRTGLVAERFGGQLLDTMAIENFSSVSYTEGPKLANELLAHVREYDVDVVLSQRVSSLEPEDGAVVVTMDSGATLTARTVILATGARWRTMGVPGEQEYRNKGVTFCPHCDGPLFKGKRVAVIGGGNSGVEAAIDLSGVVGHVTLLEFDSALRADDVLQRKLRSLANVDVILEAATTQVRGDGTKVTGLAFDDRVTGSSHLLDLEGVFVQIGLLPNTEWLKGSVDLNDHGEVVVDGSGRTSMPGVFAAGDCTTSAFKQIVVALGTGATASLSAFDHLIRT